MRKALAISVLLGLMDCSAWGFEENELRPARPGVQCMWHVNDGGAHVCFFEYKFVNPDAARLLEGMFDGYTFYVVAVWNKEGKGNFAYDPGTHTFRLNAKGDPRAEKPPKVWGNIDPWEGFLPRINERISQINKELVYTNDMLDKLRYNALFTEDMFSDESGQWAKSRKLTSRQALNSYKAKLDAAAKTMQNLIAVMRPFNCAVGSKCWALCPVRSGGRSLTLDSVFYVVGEKQVEMKCVSLTKSMINKLEIRQRDFGARYEFR